MLSAANLFALLVLFSWPFVAVFFYKTQSLSRATILTILCAVLLLPAQLAVKVEMIPAFDKNSISTACALAGCWLLGRRKRAPLKLGFVEVLSIIFVISPFITSLLNGDPLFTGDKILPGVDAYDGISAALSQLIILVPFLVGRRYLNEPKDTEQILRILVVAGLLYSVPMLFEVRMSPQLSNWIYGYFPSTFASESRYGGFRPVVFMINGLALSFFMSTTVLASVALWRTRANIKTLPPLAITGYLMVILVLCKSAGSLIYGIIFGPVVAWLRAKVIIGTAVALVAIALIYPVLRTEHLFPHQLIVDAAKDFSEERAGSLETRFSQEEMLLSRSSERPIFGWGRFGRSRVYDQYGKDISLTDGRWIIIMGQFGIVGFLAEFGLIALAVFKTAASFKFLKSKQHMTYLATLGLIVALDLIEQLPNSSLSPWSWLLAGSLLGTSEQLKLASIKTKRSISRTTMVSSDQT